MKYRTLGDSGLKVSTLCLGSMTWGSQNTEAEGHRQIDMALEAGVNFIDTAEMYPVNPVRVETIGNTEKIIGNWFAKSGKRDKVILATKAAGAGQAARGGAPITAVTVRNCIEDSLRRLQTDVIDLYQLHVPNRGTWSFRRNWTYDPSVQNTAAVAENMAEVMGELAAQVKAGRIRAFGLSNETAWGVIAWNRTAAACGGPRVASVQNEYSLLCRLYDLDLAEVSHHENVALLAFSPLATGLLTGKYGAGMIPTPSRRARSPELGGRITPRVWGAVEAYMAIAKRHGLDPAQMALAFVLSRPFLGSAILGATTEAQLANDLAAVDVTLSAEVLDEIAAAHKAWPMPF
ncbi:aldo/keto reductase [Frigidibacter sp. ROC022]|uniref:aldo/keto reductase n=1 Tax=Frigidibacter sp. ROC022 TaxID=2971796 RepID=UPI00215B69BB|nr:aldo/keto reductase [Frigidibacter sp. ROC022]MCR8723665.1 aldo/keto reductase [Frigidibacter sp. ROC022]